MLNYFNRVGYWKCIGISKFQCYYMVLQMLRIYFILTTILPKDCGVTEMCFRGVPRCQGKVMAFVVDDRFFFFLPLGYSMHAKHRVARAGSTVCNLFKIAPIEFSFLILQYLVHIKYVEKLCIPPCLLHFL